MTGSAASPCEQLHPAVVYARQVRAACGFPESLTSPLVLASVLAALRPSPSRGATGTAA